MQWSGSQNHFSSALTENKEKKNLFVWCSIENYNFSQIHRWKQQKIYHLSPFRSQIWAVGTHRIQFKVLIIMHIFNNLIIMRKAGCRWITCCNCKSSSISSCSFGRAADNFFREVKRVIGYGMPSVLKMHTDLYDLEPRRRTIIFRFKFNFKMMIERWKKKV